MNRWDEERVRRGRWREERRKTLGCRQPDPSLALLDDTKYAVDWEHPHRTRI